ncbi:metal ABC transporter solute-binding protein, Zn/Mn family [Nocardioides bruguierae]|uniref:Zinc ABC transporter substrate-binding protein n=1 Tax=Nocardioides bruguierae TaxID=2945102 RepID=A0A9X2IF31_9ACTN|nr:zinc ABC transporter substrate-binding protein [Nocardioides bruguierae]MCM0619270.1 zinc ABC transporter substrate-binding protein [Nocardioides bruguierae]
MKTSSWRLLALLPAGALAVTTLAACGSDSGSADDGTISIVASTNVYGSIAEAIGGDDVEVTSIIDSASQDPHEYEATTSDLATLSGADIVIENGGGYDSFVDTMLDSVDTDPTVLTAVDISGLLDEDSDHSDEEHADEESEDGHDHVEGFNEHVWYDFHTVEAVAEEINEHLAEVDPDNAATYQANYEDFAAQVEDLESQVSDLASSTEGRGVAITEPVPLYLLTEAGLTNETPDEFSEAVEEGTDVPPRVLAETLALFDGDSDIAVLAYNTQAADDTTEQVQQAAEAAGVPVVDFSETLPDGVDDYVTWMQDNVDDLTAALG